MIRDEGGALRRTWYALRWCARDNRVLTAVQAGVIAAVLLFVVGTSLDGVAKAAMGAGAAGAVGGLAALLERLGVGQRKRDPGDGVEAG